MHSDQKSKLPFARVLPRLSTKSQTAVVIAAFSIFYFADVLLRASEKSFWYDEVLTLYFARFKDLHLLWGALATGVESNPPTFHLLTRTVQSLFGQGQIATRLPEIASFWLFCICLYHFVQRRAGVLAGFIAMALPLLSGAYFYAYEARPLGIVMSLAGVALVCWDHANSAGGRLRRWWLIALCCSILGALAMHAYGALILIPFGIAELVRIIRTARIRWDIWLAMCLPLLPAAALYVPLIRAFATYTQNSDFLSQFPAVWPLIPGFYLLLIQDSPLVFTIILLLLAIKNASLFRAAEAIDEEAALLTVYDLLVCLGFLSLPVLGVGLARALHTSSFPRYFLSATVGFSVLIALGLGGWKRPPADSFAAFRFRTSLIAKTAAAVIVVALLSGFTRMVRHRNKQESEITPVTQYTDQKLIDTIRSSTQPIAALDMRDFLYLIHYRPELTPRLYAVDLTPRGMNYYGAKNFRPWSPTLYNPPLTVMEFARQHPLSYIYGPVTQLNELSRVAGVLVLTSCKSDGIHFLVHSAPATARGE